MTLKEVVYKLRNDLVKEFDSILGEDYETTMEKLDLEDGLLTAQLTLEEYHKIYLVMEVSKQIKENTYQFSVIELRTDITYDEKVKETIVKVISEFTKTTNQSQSFLYVPSKSNFTDWSNYENLFDNVIIVKF